MNLKYEDITEIKVGLLINFGREEVEFKRFVY
jgi:hypothetical protein